MTVHTDDQPVNIADQTTVQATGSMSYQDKAAAAGATFERVNYAIKFLKEGNRITLHEIDDQHIKGTGYGSHDRTYPFSVDLVDVHKSTCTCGYYLPYKNGDIELHNKFCSHQIAGLITADNGALTLQPREVKIRAPKTPRSPRQAKTSAPDQSQHISQAFRDKLDRAIAKAVKVNIVDMILEVWDQDMIPFLIGPPGTGKTRGTVDAVAAIGFDGYETQEGTDSCTEVDLVGLETNGLRKPGVLARAFSRARDGQRIVIMIDELARLNQRAQDVFLPALTPVPPSAAKLEGIVTDDWVYIVHSPLWGIEWAPVKNIKFVFGANPWGAKFDNAFMDRIGPCKVNYDPNVLKHFDQPMIEAITELWNLARDGMVPLPLSYRGISKAKNPGDTRIFKWYLAKLEQLNVTAYNMVLDILVNRGLWKLDPTQQAASLGGLTI